MKPYPAFVRMILHPEEEPLGASGGIDIFLQQQVVLMLSLPSAGHRQVAALEPTLKGKRGLGLWLDGWMQAGFGVEGFDACEGVVIGVGVVSVVGPV